MAIFCAGDTYKIDNDANILKIDSPKGRITGPYVVVHRNLDDRYAVVALDFKTDHNLIKPRLGIRWFWGKAGTPFIRRSAWFIIPEELQSGVVGSFRLSLIQEILLRRFLSGKIDGNRLKNSWDNGKNCIFFIVGIIKIWYHHIVLFLRNLFIIS